MNTTHPMPWRATALAVVCTCKVIARLCDCCLCLCPFYCRLLVAAVVCNQAAAVVLFVVYMFIKRPPLDSASAASGFGNASAASAKPAPPSRSKAKASDADNTQPPGGISECLSRFPGQVVAWFKSRPQALRDAYAEDANFRCVCCSWQCLTGCNWQTRQCESQKQ